MPAMGLAGSVIALGFTMSLAPMISTTSVSGKSSLISSISKTMSYGTDASASSTFMCPGSRPATGWIAKRTLMSFFFSSSTTSQTACCARATAMP